MQNMKNIHFCYTFFYDMLNVLILQEMGGIP